MAQTTQIVPKFSFPYVETHINDYTLVDQGNNAETTDNTIKYVFAFTGSMGIDNKWIRKKSYTSFVSTYGTSNYKKFGQPLMMPLNVLQQDNTSVWCMRVMPENAAYANNIISLYYKADTATEFGDADASKRKFRIKFTQKTVENLTDLDKFTEAVYALDGLAVKGVYKDEDGYTQAPFMGVRGAGRGSYGDDYCLRLSQNSNYEKEYGIKMYNFDIMTINGGLTKIANYVGAFSTSTKYNVATLINDILEDTEAGVTPVEIVVDENSVESVYDAYIAFCKAQYPLLVEEYNTKLAAADGVTEAMVLGGEDVPLEQAEDVAELRRIKSLINATENDTLPDLDVFDPVFGTYVNSTELLPYMCFVQELTEDVDTEADDYDAKDYTSTTKNMPVFGSTKGITLANGSDGYFADPRTTRDEVTGREIKWTVDEEVEECYNHAFDGTYDRRILSSRRIPATALWDANYPFSVKNTLADLTLLRSDCILYLDTGIQHKTYSNAVVKTLINDYSVFNNCLISKNLQHYTVKEPSTMKRVVVSITYFLAEQYAYHMTEFGGHIPFVKGYAQLSGHIADTLEPTVEDFESELKEEFYDNRFNYFETLDENVYQRGTQNTSQIAETDLLEESNVTTLYQMKRSIEQDIQAKLYDFADEGTRAAFKSYEEAVFADWIGNKILSLEIQFKANEWEAEHSILHAYLAVVFRGLQKKAIVEIDINKRTYTSSDQDAEE